MRSEQDPEQDGKRYRERPSEYAHNDRAPRARVIQQTQDGTAIPMTLGWHIGTAARVRFYYKEGGGGGFHCMMRLYPESSIATVVMTNATGFDVFGFLNAIDARFMFRAQR